MFSKIIEWLTNRTNNTPRLPHWAGVRGAGQLYVKDVNAMLDDPKTQRQLEVLRKIKVNSSQPKAIPVSVVHINK